MALLGCRGVSPEIHELGGAGNVNEPSISVQPPPDEKLEARLRAIYAQIDGLGEVDVRVRDGVVHLAGVAESLALEQRAAGIAQRLEGVVHVSSTITSEPSDRLLASTWRTFRDLGRATFDVLPKLAAAVLVFLPFLLLAWGLGRWRRPLNVLGVRQLTGSIVRFVLRGIVLVAGLLLSLEILGIVGIVGAVVGTLGLLGLAAGIAFKDWVANYFPALMLGLHPPFKSGDLVQVGEHEGRIVKITPRATVLMTTDGEQVRIPNSYLFQHTLVNFSHHRERRLRFTLPLSTSADLRMAHELGRSALRALEGIVDDPPPFMRTRGFSPGIAEVEFFAWVDQERVSFLTVQSRARRAVLEALSRGGIPLAEETVIVRPAPEPPASRPRAPEAGADDVEQHDVAFLGRQLERARLASVDRERDLLAEGAPRAPTPPAGAPGVDHPD